VLFKTASVEENKLGERGAAAATYRRILAEPETMSSMATTMRALRALEKIYTQSGDSESLAEVLERSSQQIAVEGGLTERSERDIETQIMISFQLGELYELHLEQAGKGARALSPGAAADGRSSPDAGRLERFLVPGNPVRVEVARCWCPRTSESDDTRKLAARSRSFSAPPSTPTRS
jgi:hypothetical protein